MKKSFLRFTAAASVVLTGAASAAITVDGSLDVADYGTSLFTQDTPTQFGDNTDATTNVGTGSEIDGIYAVVDGGNLNILVTGNIETNFNRLVLYIDSVAGGQNTLDATTGGAFNDYNGIVFDAGFGADYGLIINGGGGPPEFYLDFGVIGTSSTFVGGSGAGNTTISSGGISAGVNNSNTAGVTDTLTAGAAAVTTGIEFSVSLADLGSPTSDIKIAGFVAGGSFLSNQVIGGVGGAGNLGNASPADFSQIAGDQFVTVAIPEPASLALIALGGLAMLGRRRSA